MVSSCHKYFGDDKKSEGVEHETLLRKLMVEINEKNKTKRAEGVTIVISLILLHK